MTLQEFLDSDKCPKYAREELKISLDDDGIVVSCYEGDKCHYEKGCE